MFDSIRIRHWQFSLSSWACSLESISPTSEHVYSWYHHDHLQGFFMACRCFMVFEADGGILPIFKAITCKSKIASASFHPFGLQCRHTHMAKYNVIWVVCMVMQPGPRGKPGRLARPLHYLLFSKLTFGEDELWRRMRWLRREIRQARARSQRLWSAIVSIQKINRKSSNGSSYKTTLSVEQEG